MPAIEMVSEDEASGRVRDIYEEIKSTFGIDFVPNLYKVMASNPAYLEANWNKVKAVMIDSGKLDRLTKEIIAVAVSAGEQLRLLTASPHFCGAEAGIGRPSRPRVDGGRRPVQRFQQAHGWAPRRARREALVWLRLGRMNAVSIH